jgi:hypothetical protein
MSAKNFTPQAELLWSTVWPEARERFLQAVFCTRCRTAVEIVDYSGREKNGDLALESRCRNCGHQVCRVVETSEAPIPPS